MLKLHRAVALAATLVAAAPAGPAPNELRMDGLGPVHTGMTVAEAEKALGVHLKIDYLEENAGPDACGTGERSDGKNPDVFYMVEGGKIVRIDVTTRDDGKASDPPIRTHMKVGVGSTEVEVKRAYRRELKIERHPYLDEAGHYLIVKAHDGKSAIIFETDHGKVTTFRAGLYPAVGYIEGCA